MLGVEGKEFQKINQKKTELPKLALSPLMQAGNGSWLSFLLQLGRLRLLLCAWEHGALFMQTIYLF